MALSVRSAQTAIMGRVVQATMETGNAFVKYGKGNLLNSERIFSFRMVRYLGDQCTFFWFLYAAPALAGMIVIMIFVCMIRSCIVKSREKARERRATQSEKVSVIIIPTIGIIIQTGLLSNRLA